MKATKASTPISAFPFVYTPSTYSLADGSVQASEGNFNLPDFERNYLGARPLELEPEPIVLGIINELEVEDDMATDLRVGFKKRHRKHLHKAIEVVAPPAKRA